MVIYSEKTTTTTTEKQQKITELVFFAQVTIILHSFFCSNAIHALAVAPGNFILSTWRQPITGNCCTLRKRIFLRKFSSIRNYVSVFANLEHVVSWNMANMQKKRGFWVKQIIFPMLHKPVLDACARYLGQHNGASVLGKNIWLRSHFHPIAYNGPFDSRQAARKFVKIFLKHIE